MNQPISFKIKEWQVSGLPSGSDQRNIIYTYEFTRSEKVSTKMGRNYHRANWEKFRLLVNTSKMSAIANRHRWTPLLIEAATDKWYNSVNIALYQVCKPSKLKIKNVADWWNEDCESAKRKYRNKEKRAYRRGRPSPADLTELRALNRSLKNCIKAAKKDRFQEFVSKVETLPEMAKLSKILRSKVTNKLGLVRKQDGSLTISPEESLKTMIEEHFPGSSGTTEPVLSPPKGIEKEIEPILWITPERSWMAINSFGPHKACGPDKLKPIVLQHLPKLAVEALSLIFMAVIALASTPIRWRNSDVVFIDKPGKKDLENLWSFRPISLMSFVYKTLEKLVAMDLEENTFKSKLMHEDQFGFMKGKSTEHALSATVNEIEKGFHKKECVVVTLLDIKGPFDNIKPSAIIKAMRKQGVRHKVCE
jgi:hypothetical protein